MQFIALARRLVPPLARTSFAPAAAPIKNVPSLASSFLQGIPGIPVRFMGKGARSHSSSKKRFKVSSGGRLVRAGAGKSHNTGKHSRKIIRNRGFTKGFGCPQMERNIRKIMSLPTRF